ncbi:type II/IV secretion system protein [Ideonella sp. 4Y16]|uniref:Type II/IV secretion system protein n=1 Tax=Ideonella alba TaxID=2824118 RepID=A0A941BD94_9BURK|nr:GspE/PulE family protein [Ideonella alba]MBQ0929986.1 type II/IV secretion system protein [Ideonella alba]MBQ0946000.1 type II/IV secretion system protein [Ideonella alba]
MSTAPRVPRAATFHGRLDLRHLLRWLRDDGLLPDDEAERLARRFGSTDSSLHPLTRLAGAGLADRRDGRALDGEALAHWLARRAGLPFLKIDPLRVDAGRVAEVMSQAYAESRRALPVAVGPAEVTVATCEPFDRSWVSEIEAHTRRRLKLVVSTPEDLSRYTTEFYRVAQNVHVARKSGEGVGATHSFEQLVDLKARDNLDANDQGVIQLVDWLWQYAFEQRASDIHLEPRRDLGVVRFRIDGVLHPVHQVPAAVMAAMTARIKLLGRMDVIERRRPQDGRIKTRRPDGAGGGEVEMRLSTLPTAFGEKVVMRIFDPGTVDKPFDALGFSADEARRWNALIARPHGIVLVTGPTGSGKTTTLYSTLKKLATEEVNVCTVEDPIEMIEPSFNQTQVQPVVELGFAEGLRALMRQDPDIIMVGEIRDLETAEMAIQAALTGHLVFSTLHTNDAPSAITRLVDLGVPPYLISATVIGVLAQRLTRSLCLQCRQPDPVVSAELAQEYAAPWRPLTEPQAWKPVGCPACRQTGYRGRTALYELMELSESLRSTMHPQLDEPALRRAAVQAGLRPLRMVGLDQVGRGRTTLEEVLRSTPRWEC